MSLLKPAESQPDSLVELNGIAASDAITLLRSVDTYGSEVAQNLTWSNRQANSSLAAAHQAALQVERAAIDASFKPVDFDEKEVADAVHRARDEHRVLSFPQETMVDYYDDHQTGYSYTTANSQLEFIARCLARGAKEDAGSQQYEDVLNWMRQKPEIKPTIEAIDKQKDPRVVHLGRKMTQFFRRPAGTRGRPTVAVR